MPDDLNATTVDPAEWDRRKQAKRTSGEYQTAIRKVAPIGKVSGHAEDTTATPAVADPEWEPEPNPPGWAVAKGGERWTIDQLVGDYLQWLKAPESDAFRFTLLANFRLNGGMATMSDEAVLAAAALRMARESVERVYRDVFDLERPVVIGNSQ